MVCLCSNFLAVAESWELVFMISLYFLGETPSAFLQPSPSRPPKTGFREPASFLQLQSGQ